MFRSNKYKKVSFKKNFLNGSLTNLILISSRPLSSNSLLTYINQIEDRIYKNNQPSEKHSNNKAMKK